MQIADELIRFLSVDVNLLLVSDQATCYNAELNNLSERVDKGPNKQLTMCE